MSSVETDLSDGIAAILEAAGIGIRGASTGTAIVSKELNPQPHRGIAIVIGGVGDNVSTVNGRRTLQLRTRGTTDTRDVDDLAQAAYRVLHGLRGLQLGTTGLGHLYRTSFTTLGRDATGRWERSDNYLADITEPPSPLRLG